MKTVSLTEPTFDENGDPTEETLERIRTWDINTFQDCADAMDFAGKLAAARAMKAWWRLS